MKKIALVEDIRIHFVEQSSMHPNSTLICFNIEDFKAATKNFHRDNIIGVEGYGNVYKGVSLDGSIVIMKRFKNCTPTGDASFVHEVHVIISI